MEIQIAPTSPKKDPSRALPQDAGGSDPAQKSFFARAPIGVYVITALIGLIAGASAALFIFIQSDWFGFITNGPQITKYVANDAAHIFSQNEASIQNLETKISPSVLMIFKGSSSQPSVSSPLAFAGEAVFLTTDGLAMTTTSVVSGAESFIAITPNGRSEAVSQIYRDQVSGLAFFRVQGNGFSSVQLPNQTTLFPRSQLYIFWQQERIKSFATLLSQIQYAPHLFTNVESSERFFEQVLLTESGVGIPQGALLFSGDGSLYGLFNGTAESPSVVYLPERRSLIDQYLSKKEIRYPYLGIRGYDLSKTIFVNNEGTPNFSQGFLLAADSQASLPAVISKSPAVAAGLQAGDIITKYNDIELDKGNRLQFLLLMTEQDLTVSVVRGSKTVTLPIRLEFRSP